MFMSNYTLLNQGVCGNSNVCYVNYQFSRAGDFAGSLKTVCLSFNP